MRVLTYRNLVITPNRQSTDVDDIAGKKGLKMKTSREF